MYPDIIIHARVFIKNVIKIKFYSFFVTFFLFKENDHFGREGAYAPIIHIVHSEKEFNYFCKCKQQHVRVVYNAYVLEFNEF